MTRPFQAVSAPGTGWKACVTFAAILLAALPDLRADCCGGGNMVGGGGEGMPPIGKFTEVRRLRLEVFPGTRAQNVDIHDLRTGALLYRLPVGGGTVPSAPFGFSLPASGQPPLRFSVQDAPGGNGNGGGGGGGGSVKEMAQGSGDGGGEDQCKKPPQKCNPDNSGGGDVSPQPPASLVEPGTQTLCTEAGTGTTSNTSDQTPDQPSNPSSDNQNSQQAPMSPSPPGAGGSAAGTTTAGAAPPAPGLFGAMLEGVRRTKGAAHLEMSTGLGSPKLTFSKRFIGNNDSASPNFRRYFTTSLLREYGRTFSSEGLPILAAIQVHSFGGGLADANGIRSIVTDEHLVNVFQRGASWEITFTPLEAQDGENSRQIELGSTPGWIGHLLVKIIYPDNAGVAGDHIALAEKKWVIAYGPPYNGLPTLDVKFYSQDFAQQDLDAVMPKSVTRYWQKTEGGIVKTAMHDVNERMTYEIWDRSDAQGNYLRGEVTTRGPESGGARSGWFLQTGPDYEGQPLPYPDVPEATVVNFGGEGNTVWKWTSTGPWEKKTVTPNMDALVRRIETLRPAPGVPGAAATPQEAEAANSHSTVEEISASQSGDVVTMIEAYGGQETSRITRAQGRSADYFFATDTVLRYPAGLLSAPLVSYTQRVSEYAPVWYAGRTVRRVEEDGSQTVTGYSELNGARIAKESRLHPDGRIDVTTTTENADGQIVQSERSVNLGSVASELPKPVERTRWTYEPATGSVATIQKQRAVNGTWPGAWQTVFSTSYGVNRDGTPNTYDDALVLKISETETDETGVVTESSSLDAFGNAKHVKRWEAGGIPAQWTAFTYDDAGRMLSRTSMTQDWTAPLAPLQKEALTYDTQGRVAARTVNEALVTEYRYPLQSDYSQTVREYHYAFGQAAPAANAPPFSETTTSVDGRTVTRSGTGVVAETRTVLAPGGFHTRETVLRGDVETVRESDAAGRTVAELVNVPGGAWRTWTYDGLGRRAEERIGGTKVREWSYSGGAVTETATPGGAEPQRTTVHSSGYVADAAGVWEERRDAVPEGAANAVVVQETRVKVAGFAADELSVRQARGADGNWTTTTATVNLPSKTVTETTLRPGASQAHERRTQAGLVVWEKAPGAAATTYLYDALGRVQSVNQNGVRTTAIGYEDIYGQAELVTTTGHDGTVSKSRKTYYEPGHASAGRVKTSAVWASNNEADALTTYYTWTARGEMRVQWGATYPVKYEYDAAGRLWKMWTWRADPTGTTPATSNPENWTGGDATEWVYYPGTMALHQKLDASVPAGQGASYTYAPDGTLATRTWARGVVATYTHNLLGEMTGITYSGEPAGQQTPAVSLARDARGRVVSVAAGAEARTYGWRADGRLEREDASDGHALLYGYDAAGRRTGYALWENAAAGYATWGGWGYSGATGKLNGVSTPEGWVAQSYDPATGAPSVWGMGGFTESYTRDGLGRVVLVTGSANGITGHDAPVTRTYTYNGQGQRETLSEENGEAWSFDYNKRGEVKEGVKKAGATALRGMKRGYQYDAIGNRTELRVHGVTGTIDNNWYPNERNQITSRNVEGMYHVLGKAAAAAQVTVAAEADDVPYKPSVTMLARGPGNRFGAVIDTKNPGVAKYVKVKVTEEVTPGSGHDSTGHLFVPASPEQFGYDTDGSLKQDGRWEYTYDGENRLIATKTREGMLIAGDPLPIERIEYRYDAFGRRTEMKVSVKTSGVWKVTKVTKFAYDGWNLIAEWEQVATLNTQLSPLNLRRTHHWGLDLSGTLQGAGGVGGLVLTRHLGPGASAYSAFPAYDGNGNIMALFETASGRRVAEYEYGPFGEALRATGPMAEGNPFRWSTKYTDNETGLVYYGYRYYSALTGRWLSEDPAREKGHQIYLGASPFVPTSGRSSVNRYGFADNTPTVLVDADGRVIPIIIAVAVVWFATEETAHSPGPGDSTDPADPSGPAALAQITLAFCVPVSGEEVLGEMAGRVVASAVTKIGSCCCKWVSQAFKTKVDPNRLHHIFAKPGRNLDDFADLFGGNQADAFRAVEKAVKAAKKGCGEGKFEVEVIVEGKRLWTQGKVMPDGTIRLNTFGNPQ